MVLTVIGLLEDAMLDGLETGMLERVLGDTSPLAGAPLNEGLAMGPVVELDAATDANEAEKDVPKLVGIELVRTIFVEIDELEDVPEDVAEDALDEERRLLWVPLIVLMDILDTKMDSVMDTAEATGTEFVNIDAVPMVLCRVEALGES